MKIKAVLLCISLVCIQCSIDQEEDTLLDLTSENLVLSHEDIRLSELPNPALDTDRRGLYQGTIVTSNIVFHEKITINMGNNGSYNAWIKTKHGELYTFKTRKSVNSSDNHKTFIGKLGHFKVRYLDDDTLEVYDAVIQNTLASINIFKDRSTHRMIPTLGTFTSNDGSITGTWDFTFSNTSSLGFSIPNVTIFVNQNSETFVLDISGNYQRLCSAPGTSVPIGVVNSSFFNIQSSNNVPLGNSNLNFTIVANRLEAANVGCLDLPSATLDTNINTWIWNGISGTSTIDTSSLPDFSEI